MTNVESMDYTHSHISIIARLFGTEEASKDGRVRVRIIHGLNISHKELTYLLQKSITYRAEVLSASS